MALEGAPRSPILRQTPRCLPIARQQGRRTPCSVLVDFQWKLGMAVSSDICRSLKYPYVAVMLKVADHSGQVKTKCFEMTIPQFQNFYRQFKEIAAVIETV
ncbi:PREDICTED: COMM domain-containing protein 6 isoform X1 [Colobus angolensis palliatus]|uniref:COMM domain-containing protein 6 isoform X1 n=1 Tax=Colobus angolensis palliatus TaxID=336983 RepID=UPI0005F4E165|nr:PREDICTED: COMM domain-containing protein 6 isoform X1 [Colobus angolensis palliatus]